MDLEKKKKSSYRTGLKERCGEYSSTFYSKDKAEPDSKLTFIVAETVIPALLDTEPLDITSKTF